MALIFIVDDYTHVAGALTRYIRRLDCELRSFTSAREARKAAEQRAPDVLIADVYLGDGTGPELARALKRLNPLMKTIFVSAVALRDDPNFGGEDVVLFPKPWPSAELFAVLKEYLQEASLPQSAAGGSRP